MRNVSLNMREALFSQESGEVAIFLVTITHPDLDLPILLTSDATTRLSTDPLKYGTVSNGQTFLYAGMTVSLPDEQEKSPPACQLIIPNIDRSIIPLARSIVSPASAKIQIVLASAPDLVEIEVPALDMVNLTYDVINLTFGLAMDALATEPFPAGTFNPADFGGLFF
jgi:hypothetical protein